VPDLSFEVVDAEVVPFAAVPSLLFKLRVENLEDEPIRSVALNTQIRISATQRHYEAGEQERLLELFGEPSRWKDTLRSLDPSRFLSRHIRTLSYRGRKGRGGSLSCLLGVPF
jgi:hypothetical protein